MSEEFCYFGHDEFIDECSECGGCRECGSCCCGDDVDYDDFEEWA